MTVFNILVAPSAFIYSNELSRLLVVTIGIALQLLCTILLFASGSIDPGIIPGMFFSAIASAKIHRKYYSVKVKRQRIFYLTYSGKAAYGSSFANSIL